MERKRLGYKIIHALLIACLTATVSGLPSSRSLAYGPASNVIQDWRTIEYGPDDTEYLVRLALKSGSISGALDPGLHDDQLDAIAVYQSSTGQRLGDAELERVLVFLAQSQALMESDPDWKADPWNIDDEAILYSAQDNQGVSLTIRQSKQFTQYYRDYLTGPLRGEIRSFSERSRLYRDVARLIALPYLDGDKDVQAIEQAFDRDFGESLDQAVADMEPFPEAGTGVEIAQWTVKLLQAFNVLVGQSHYAALYATAIGQFSTMLSGAAGALGAVNMGITRDQAIQMAKNVAQVSAQNSFYTQLRLEALEYAVGQEPWDYAAAWGLVLLRNELSDIQAGDVQAYWQEWLAQNPVKELLTIQGIAVGCAKIAGATISAPVGLIFLVVWVGAQAWFFIDEQAEAAVSSWIALTFEYYIRKHMDDGVTAGCSGNAIQTALLLNNMRYRAASLYYKYLYDKHHTFFNSINIFDVPDEIVESWAGMAKMYDYRFTLTLPPAYLVRLEAVHDGASTAAEVEAYANWFVQKIRPLDQPLGPAITQYGVTPEYGSYQQTFRFEAVYRCTEPVAPDDAHVIVDGQDHALAQVATETFDNIVYYHTYRYEVTGLAVGTYEYYFDIGAATPTAVKSLEVSSDPSLGRPAVSIVYPQRGTQVSGRVEIQAWTLTGRIEEVDFYINTHFVHADTASPWGCSWNTEGAFNSNGPVELMVVARDASGTTVSDRITVQVYNPARNEAPTIHVLSPSGDADYGRFTIRWEDEDLDDPAMISLYYDNNNSGLDGTLIQSYLNEDWASDWWSWDISELPDGHSAWVYAKIDDGVNPPVYDYSPGPLTVQAPATADNFEVDHFLLDDDCAACDHDGVPDAGEELALKIYVRNKSGQKQCFVQGELSTAAPGVDITDASVNYQSPVAGQITPGVGDFDLLAPPGFDGAIDLVLRLVYEDCSGGTQRLDAETVVATIHPDDTTPPIITAGPQPAEITPASALITWTTGEPASSVVDYGLTAAYGSQATTPGYTTTHAVQLTGLQGGMTYHFRASSTDPSGNGPAQATGQVTTTNVGDGLHVDDAIYTIFNNIRGLTWDGAALWILGEDKAGASQVCRYDPATRQILSCFDLDLTGDPGSNYCGLAWDGTYLWLANSSEEEVYRLTTAGSLVAKLDVPYETPCGLTWGNGHLWLSDMDQPAVYELTTAGAVVSSFSAPDPSPRELAWGQDTLWIVDNQTRQLFKLTPAGQFVDLYPLYGYEPRGLAFAGSDHLWASVQGGATDLLLSIQTVEDTVSPSLSAPTVSGISAGSAQVTWSADEPVYGLVNYGLDATYGQTVTLSTIAVTHTASLVGLSPGQIYHYRAGGRDLPGNDITWSGDYTFTTATATTYNVRNFFRPSAMNGWRVEAITWDSNSGRLWFVDGLLDHFMTVEADDGDLVQVPLWNHDNKDANDIAWDRGYVWVANGDTNADGKYELFRVNPSTGLANRTLVFTPGVPHGIAWDGNDLWVSRISAIHRVDDVSGSLLGTIPVPAGTRPGKLAWDGAYLWMVDRDSNTVYRLTTGGTVVDAVTAPFSDVTGVAWDGHYLWLADDLEDTFYQLDPAPTNGPVVAAVISTDIDHGYTHEYYPAGSRVLITATEQYGRAGLTGAITITSAVDDPGIRAAPLTDNGDGSYSYLWVTAGQAAADDYGVEVRLTDGTYTDGDGLARQPDLRIGLAKDYSIAQTVTLPALWSLRGLAWQGDNLWVSRNDTDGRITRVDVNTGGVLADFAAPLNDGDQGPYDLDWNGAHLCLANHYPNGVTNVTKHNLTTGALVSTINLSGVASQHGIAFAGSDLWSVDDEQLRINRFPAGGGSPSLWLTAPSYHPYGLEWDGANLWLADGANHRLTVMTTAGAVVDRYVQPNVDDIAFHGADVWGVGSSGDSVYRLALKPDLAVEPLALSAGSAPEGATVQVTATLHATNVPATGAVLRFYQGDPDSGGVQIGADRSLGAVTPGTPRVETIAWSPAAVGLYDLYARVDPLNAVDEGNETNNTVSARVVVYDADPEPPLISNVSAEEEGGDGDGYLEDNESIRIAWTATDAGSGISATSVTIGGATTPGLGGYYAVAGPLPTDVYTFTIRAEDHSGEVATYEAELGVMPHALEVDEAFPPPNAPEVHPSDQVGARFETDVAPESLAAGTFTLTSTEGVSVTGWIVYDVAGRTATFVPETELDNAAVYTATWQAGAQGPVDEYRNTLETAFEWTFVTEPDTTPPVAALSGPEPGPYYHGEVGLFGSALDKNLDGYRIQVEAGTSPAAWLDAAPVRQEVADGYLGLWNTETVSDGLYTVRLVVSDTFGLESTDTLVLRVDNTPPGPPANLFSPTHSPGVWSTAPVVQAFWSEVTDAGSGLAGYSVAWDVAPGGQPAPVVMLEPGETMTASPALADGAGWTFVLSSRDVAGNWSAPVSLGPFPIDTTPPESAVLPLPTATAGLRVEVCWEGEDATSGIAAYDVWVKDGEAGTWGKWQDGIDGTCATFNGQEDHTYYFQSVAQDLAANLEAGPQGDGDAWTTLSQEAIHWGVYLPLVVR